MKQYLWCPQACSLKFTHQVVAKIHYLCYRPLNRKILAKQTGALQPDASSTLKALMCF